MVHRIVVEDQSLRWYGRPPKIADDSIEFVRFQFHLPEDWDPLVLVAQFTQTDSYNMLLDGAVCFLPKELTAGLCKLSLFGYAEGKPLRATSIPLVFQIEESGFVSSAETPIPPTPDLYTQLIEHFSGGGIDVQNASPGQMIIVKAVDENGKPTEWEAVDPITGADWNAAEGEPGHILNRTHYTEGGIVELLPECNPTYDEGEGTFVIMGAIPFVVGEEITVNWNGTPYKCGTYAFTPDTESGKLVAFGNSEALAEITGMETEENTAPFVGLYLAIQSMLMMLPLDESSAATVAIYSAVGKVHKLDNKYLDLDWLPVRTHAKGEIVAERTGSANYFGTAWFGQATPYNVTPGKYYFVVWNGDEYRVQFEPGTGEHVYGSFGSNAFKITYMYDSSEVPSLRYGFRCRPLDGSTEVALSIYESVAVPNKIPDEFLPDDFGGNVDLTGVVKTVNGKTPDENGNVEITIPDSGGNVDQTALFEHQEPSANIFDKSSAISGYYYDIDGTVKPLSGYGSSGLVKCSPNTTYTKYLFGGKVTFYDSARGFIGGENNDTNYITTPDGCRYFRVSFSLANIDRCMILEGRIANPSTLEYVAYNKGYIKSDLLTVLQENLSEDLIAWMVQKFGSPKIRVNPTEPLNITTYAGGNNQPTHPKALYFPNGWNGHRYWMVYTPYPGNNNQEENPCITYSDDGFNWSEDGISNPIATAPSGGYNSDTHIVVVNGTMECWWREVVSNEEIIVRKKSTDGITWGEREELFRTGTYTANDCVSPSVIYDEGKYKIWAVYHRDCLKYYESADGTNWQYVRDIAVNPPGSSYKIWHFDIIKTSKGYEFVGCYQLNGSFDKNNFIYYSTSQNNIGYKYPVRILTNGYDGRFDRKELYRPCLLKMNDGTDHEYYNLYYGAQGAPRKWAIGLVQASDIESLKCYIEQEALYVDGYLEADTETEEPDVPDIPDEPDGPEVTLTSISATYSGGNVAVGTAVTALSGIVVTAHYSDGTVSVVTGYTLSGNIAEGSNTITVSYGGKTTTFTVTGIAESDEPKEIVINNLVDHSAINKGGFFDASTGEFKEQASYNSSGFIPVNPGDNIEFDGVSAAYFDANKNYVSGIPYSTTSPKTATVPDGVAYISFCFRQHASVGYFLVLPVKEAYIAIGEDIATSDNIDLTGFYADGVFKTDSTYGTLKMTNVSPGMVFAATNANTASFYDKNKTSVGQKSSSNITVPKTAVYMAVSFKKTDTLSVTRTA